MTTDADRERAERLIEAVNEALPTSYRDPSPIPRYGPTPPVPQPGVPAMSQQATDIGRAAMFCGLATVPPGLIAIGIMVASEHADPTVIGLICAAPAALAVPILAVAALIRSAARSAQGIGGEHHHHYAGPVHQEHRTVTTDSRWWGKTTNNL